ncbi:MAG TPA: cupin domain-containing protein [Pyrinomonadaceae bacterium]|jgi:anti-sigma factor ChrR (cupin superfamily)
MHGVAEEEMLELASLYALGALAGAEAADFEAHLRAGCDACRREVDALTAAAHALAYAAPPVDAPAAVRAKVEAFARAEARADAAGGRREPQGPRPAPQEAEKLTVRADEGAWRELCAGVSVKRLFLDQERGTVTSLFRLEPGARIPTHEHSGTEECLVVEGDVYTDEVSLGPGDYHCAPKGSTHETLSSVNGALLLIVAQAAPEMLRAAL